MANGLFLPDGTFQPFRAEDMGTQLATRQNAGITLGDLGGWLDVLPIHAPQTAPETGMATALWPPSCS